MIALAVLAVAVGALFAVPQTRARSSSSSTSAASRSSALKSCPRSRWSGTRHFLGDHVSLVGARAGRLRRRGSGSAGEPDEVYFQDGPPAAWSRSSTDGRTTARAVHPVHRPGGRDDLQEGRTGYEDRGGDHRRTAWLLDRRCALLLVLRPATETWSPRYRLAETFSYGSAGRAHAPGGGRFEG